MKKILICLALAAVVLPVSALEDENLKKVQEILKKRFGEDKQKIAKVQVRVIRDYERLKARAREDPDGFLKEMAAMDKKEPDAAYALRQLVIKTGYHGGTQPTPGAEVKRGGGGRKDAFPGGGEDTEKAFPGKGRRRHPSYDVDLWIRKNFAGDEVRHNPDDPDARFDYSKYLLYSGDYQDSFDQAGEALKRGKVDPETLTIYGRAAYSLGDYKLAEQSGALALKMEPSNQDAEALYKLSMGRASNVDLPSALAAVGIAPSGEAPAREGEGAASVSEGREGAGLTAAEIAAAASRQAQAPASHIQQSAALTREAASALTVRDYPAAYAIATKAIDLNSRNAQAWNYRAIADNKLRRYGEAVYDASFALGLVPGNAPALQSRSWAFSQQGKYKEALADANHTLEVEPENGFAFQNRAFALAGLGERDGALESLRRSAELDARFKPKYEAALQAPQSSDLLLLFNEEPMGRAVSASGPPAPGSRKSRFLRQALLSLSGGLLVALGLLNIVSARFREGMRSTVRRVLGAPAADNLPPVLSGGFWNQYEMIRGLGAGGMGIVYEARDRSLDRRVAVKKMRDEIRADPAERRRFVTEARTVAALHHPNIVDIYSIVEDDQDVYLVFEYVPGKTLSEFLREKGPLGYEEARKLLKGACEAVECAHKRKIIHRDLKPSNIMITEEGTAKVMDFGVARQAKDALSKMSMTNTVAGTPPYMAPEQEQGSVRQESDVYALAVCFYEMLSGELPFTGQGAGMLLNKINGRHAPLSQRMKGGIPPGLDQVMAKALAPDPDKRYRTPLEFLAAVEALSAAARRL